MGEYSKASIIKYTRKAVGMTQEELAEGICEPGTLSRYENGQLDPTDDKFERLMQKMGESGCRCLFPLRCDVANIQIEMEKLLYDIEKADWDAVKKQKEKIETKFQLCSDYPENRQYLKRIEVITEYKKRNIDIQEAIQKMREVLYETFGACEPETIPINRVLRETEILVAFNLATYYEIAKNRKKALAICKRLDEYFNRADMVNDYKPRYVVYVGYSNLLGLNGDYDDSIAICKREIELLWNKGELNYLYNFYYNMGWNIRKKIENKLEKQIRIKEAKCYVWMAYQLCKVYPENKGNLKKIEEFYNTFD